MAIPDKHKKEFDILVEYTKNDWIVPIECTEAETGDPVYVLCAAARDAVTDEVLLSPFARMFKEDPFEEWIPPEGVELLE